MLYVIGFLSLVLIWILPAVVICKITQKIVGPKISKGWCVFLCFCNLAFSSFVEFFIIYFIFGIQKEMKFGIIEYFLASIAFSIIFSKLYDKTKPSILDTEKELKEKLKNKE